MNLTFYVIKTKDLGVGMDMEGGDRFSFDKNKKA